MKKKKHRLLIYSLLSRRLRTMLLILVLFLLAIGIYDLLTETLGDAWYWIWVVFGLALFLWFYYAVLMPRSSIQLRPKNMRLQGPIYGANISYGRIHSVTPSQMGQHFPFDDLKGQEQNVLKPLYQQTCIFIELNSYPPRFKRRHFWFPKFLFGTGRNGILCVVEDWEQLSADVESFRGGRQTRRRAEEQDDTRSLARQILDLDE